MIDEQLLGFAISPDGTWFAAGPNGLTRSHDRGQSWLAAFETEGVPATAVAAGEKGLVYAAIPGGIGCSEDGGATWRFVRLPLPAPLIAALAIAPDGAIFAGTMQDGVVVSEDGGASWQGRNAGLFDLDIRSVTISPDFAVDQTLLTATSTGLFRSGNNGRVWTAYGDLPEFEPIGALVALKNGDLLAAVEDAGLWRSRTAGAAWFRITHETLPADIEMIVTSSLDGEIIITGDGSTLRSSDNGETWTPAGPLIGGINIAR